MEKSSKVLLIASLLLLFASTTNAAGSGATPANAPDDPFGNTQSSGGQVFGCPFSDGYTQTLTSVAGIPIPDLRNSETVGNRGPILFEDFILRERLAQQNRERIPERTVHARGATAKGTFTVINPMTDYTTASLFGAAGKVTPVAVRLSTVIHPRGSSDVFRDPRGFAVKFYTDEGNYDIVGLNFPVFFIRDGIRFPEMIRALKPDPTTNVQMWWRILDFFSDVPESTNVLTFLLDDLGIPKGYRHMNGSGIHTFVWVNERNEGHFVRYSFKTLQGIENILDTEVPDYPYYYHTLDLLDAIDRGDYPRWEMYVQLIPFTTDPSSLPFDPLDSTQEWPINAQYPQHLVGVLELNRRITDFHAENEQIGFTVSRMVPGILPSDDKLLQSRLFTYQDAQNYRLTVNHHLLPINRPLAPVLHDNFNGPEAQGLMNTRVYTSPINYFPSHWNNVTGAGPLPNVSYVINGTKTRMPLTPRDDFAQPRARYESWDPARRERFAMRWATILTARRMDEPIGLKVRQIWLDRWRQVSQELHAKIINHIMMQTPEFLAFKKVFFGQNT